MNLGRSLLPAFFAVVAVSLVSACGGGGGGHSGPPPTAPPTATPAPTPTPTPAGGLTFGDYDGHGTNVAGIAAANTNNGFGFAGTGRNVSLMAFQVFPSPPPSGCQGSNPPSACFANTADIATAINNAVTHGAAVINLSLGGDCTNGDDPTELAAINNALAHNVIVVAAAGNDGKPLLSAPACDPGVIAVGASALDTGTPNGSSLNLGGTATAPVEYVAGYSNYTANTQNWGLVAPGGDADLTVAVDPDYLHWIVNIYSSQAIPPFPCTPDFGSAGPPNCRVRIIGTSQATPHVAGAAALLVSVAKDLSVTLTPAQAFNYLCTSARQINAGGPAPHQGCGRLDVYRAIAALVKDANVPVGTASYLCTPGSGPQSIAAIPAASVTRTPEGGIGARRFERTISGLYRKDLIAVKYTLADSAAHGRFAATMGRFASTRNIQTFDYPATNSRVAIVHVDPAAGAAQLQAFHAAGLQAAFLGLRHRMSTDASIPPSFPNDSYYQGYAAPASGPPTNVGPLYASSQFPGQWDMHVICTANAWAYSQTNSTGTLYPDALGNANVAIAVVDTGLDLSHPDVLGKVVYHELDVTP